MGKYESRSELIVFKDQEEFIKKLNLLNIDWSMPVAIRDDCPDYTTTKQAKKCIIIYERIN